MPGIIRNDDAQVVSSAAKAAASNEEFRALAQQFQALTAGATGLEGSAQTALMAAGERVLASATRFYSMVEPRIGSLKDSAGASLACAEDSAAQLSGVDLPI